MVRRPHARRLLGDAGGCDRRAGRRAGGVARAVGLLPADQPPATVPPGDDHRRPTRRDAAALGARDRRLRRPGSPAVRPRDERHLVPVGRACQRQSRWGFRAGLAARSRRVRRSGRHQRSLGVVAGRRDDSVDALPGPRSGGHRRDLRVQRWRPSLQAALAHVRDRVRPAAGPHPRAGADGARGALRGGQRRDRRVQGPVDRRPLCVPPRAALGAQPDLVRSAQGGRLAHHEFCVCPGRVRARRCCERSFSPRDGRSQRGQQRAGGGLSRAARRGRGRR